MLRALIAIALVFGCMSSGCGGGSGGGGDGGGGDGDGDEGSACRASADCDPGLACSGPNDPRVCGVPPRERCASDADCTGAGDRCHLIADPCSADGFGSECMPPCSGDAVCGAGLRCNAGACVAVSCGAGFACATREVCDPARITSATPVYNRHHGCFPIPCSSDSACAGLACVNGVCQDGPGKCVVPVPVP